MSSKAMSCPGCGWMNQWPSQQESNYDYAQRRIKEKQSLEDPDAGCFALGVIGAVIFVPALIWCYFNK